MNREDSCENGSGPRESRQDSFRCYSGYRFPPEIIQHAIWRPFKKRGLPKAIRSDNGVPFASPNALFNLSKLAVWWLRLGIHIERIKPGPPQHRRHERMHLTLKKETTRPSGMNYLRQQERFDDFRQEFNCERPQALAMKCQAECHVPSKSPYRGLPDLEYPFHECLVTACGRLCLHRKKINISTVLADQNSASRKSTTAFGSSTL
jgi:hypothetical protein